jgi:hypothetical protein
MTTSVKSGDRVQFDFAYGYEQYMFPAEGRGSRTGMPVNILARGSAAVRVVDAADAPVAAVLRARDGSQLKVRRVDGQTMRPVRKPGGFAPCTVKQFANACKGNVGWRDSPNSPAKAECFAAAPLTSGAKTKESYGEVKWKALECRADEQSYQLNEAIRRFEGLAVVDGVVHMPCREPKLRVRLVGTERRKTLELGWTIDPMSFPDYDPTAFDFHADGDTGCPDYRFDTTIPYRDLFADQKSYRSEFKYVDFSAFGLGQQEESVEFMRAYGKAKRMSVSEVRPVEHVDPDLLAGVDALPKMTEYLRATFSCDPGWMRSLGGAQLALWNAAAESAKSTAADGSDDATKAAFAAAAAFVKSVPAKDYETAALCDFYTPEQKARRGDKSRMVIHCRAHQDRMKRHNEDIRMLPAVACRWEAVDSHRDLEAERLAAERKEFGYEEDGPILGGM